MNRIRTYREQAGLSQEQLGLACGWGSRAQGRVSNYETEKRTPSLGDLRLIVAALNNSDVSCSIDDVYPPQTKSVA